MPRTWVDGGTPALSAANLNALEAELATALARLIQTGSYNPTITALINASTSPFTVQMPDGGSGTAPAFRIKAGGFNNASYAGLQIELPLGSPGYALEVRNIGGQVKAVLDASGNFASLSGITNSWFGAKESSHIEGDNGVGGRTVGLSFAPRATYGGVWYKANKAAQSTGWHPVAYSSDFSTKTANYTVLATDQLLIGNGNSITFTLPDPTDTTHVGRKFAFKNINSTSLTLVSAGTSKTIDGAASQTLTQWAKAEVISDGTQWLIV